MSGILDVFKGKSDGRLGTPAVGMSMSGAGSTGMSSNGSSKADERNIAAIGSPAANLARERAAAAKAQIDNSDPSSR